MIVERGNPETLIVRLRHSWRVARSLFCAASTLVASCQVGWAEQLPELRMAGMIPSSSALFDAPAPEPTEPIALLLPPQLITVAQPHPVMAETTAAPAASLPTPVAATPITPTPGGLPDGERQLVEQVIRDCSQADQGVPRDARLDELAAIKIRHANVLANRGAHYAARRKLIEALRMVSAAKDSHQNSREHSAALAAGLRAIEEAEDFAPSGTQLEGELELELITAPHRTPIAKQLDLQAILPKQMRDRYFRYAQLKLAHSVANEPAGSMALHALGKVTSQMGRLDPQHHRLSHQQAMAFQQAALLSHGQNHLAAHELAVLLAESGHLEVAQDLLLKVTTHQPNATVYANLAHVQQRMGLSEQANLGQALAAQLASQGRGGTGPIHWLAPEEFSRTPGDTVSPNPPSDAGATPMTRRPRYDKRTAQGSTPATAAMPTVAPRVSSRPVNQPAPPNWR